MPIRKKLSLSKEIKQVERYEYLLVEYLKEVSSELTYLLLVVFSLILFVLIDLIPDAPANENYFFIKGILVLLIAGSFGLFGMTAITKRKIERKFELILTK